VASGRWDEEEESLEKKRTSLKIFQKFSSSRYLKWKINEKKESND
jgi:hypothetical protein